MTKRMYVGVLVSILFITADMSAISMQQYVINCGHAIEDVDNVPVIGRLTNILPFAVAAACLKKCPGQTVMVLAGLLGYALCQNESVRSMLRKYNILDGGSRSVQDQEVFDDSLFVFEGDYEVDADEEDAYRSLKFL